MSLKHVSRALRHGPYPLNLKTHAVAGDEMDEGRCGSLSNACLHLLEKIIPNLDAEAVVKEALKEAAVVLQRRKGVILKAVGERGGGAKMPLWRSRSSRMAGQMNHLRKVVAVDCRLHGTTVLSGYLLQIAAGQVRQRKQ